MLYGIKLIVSLLFIFILTINSAYSEINTDYMMNNGYVTDLDTAMSLSKDTKQNILLIFSADWCGHCTNLKEDLSSMSQLDNKIICVIDVDKYKKLARKFGAKSLPTSIILDNEFKEYTRITGYNKIDYKKWTEKHIINKVN